MRRWLDRIYVPLRLAWCRFTRQHYPLRSFENGELFLRCISCGLRTEGILIGNKIAIMPNASRRQQREMTDLLTSWMTVRDGQQRSRGVQIHQPTQGRNEWDAI